MTKMVLTKSIQITRMPIIIISKGDILDKRSIVSFDSAESNFIRAIAIDPTYVLAYEGLLIVLFLIRKAFHKRKPDLLQGIMPTRP